MNSHPLILTVSDRQALLSGSNFKFTIEKKSIQKFASQLNARELKSYMDDFDSLIKGEDVCFDFDLEHEHVHFEMDIGLFTINLLNFPSNLCNFELLFEYNGNRQIIFKLMQFLLEIFAEKLLELTKKRKLSDLSNMK